jgi:hypothetical protein
VCLSRVSAGYVLLCFTCSVVVLAATARCFCVFVWFAVLELYYDVFCVCVFRLALPVLCYMWCVVAWRVGCICLTCVVRVCGSLCVTLASKAPQQSPYSNGEKQVHTAHRNKQDTTQPPLHGIQAEHHSTHLTPHAARPHTTAAAANNEQYKHKHIHNFTTTIGWCGEHPNIHRAHSAQ